MRHAEGLHNFTKNYRLPDPKLTETGKEQARMAGMDLELAACTLGTRGWYVVVSPHIRTLQTLRGALGDAAIATLIREGRIEITPLINEVDDAVPTFEAVALATNFEQYKDEFVHGGIAVGEDKLRARPESLVPWIKDIPAINIEPDGTVTTGMDAWPRRPDQIADNMRTRLPKARKFLYTRMQMASEMGLKLLVVSHGNFLSKLTGVERPLQAEVSVHRVEQDGQTWWTVRHISRERLPLAKLELLQTSAIPSNTCIKNSHCMHMACNRAGSSPICATPPGSPVGFCACTNPAKRKRRYSRR